MLFSGITPLAATPTRYMCHTHILPRVVSPNPPLMMHAWRATHSVNVDGLDHGDLGLLGGHEGGLGGGANGGLGGGLEAKGRGAGGQDAEGGGELHGCFIGGYKPKMANVTRTSRSFEDTRF